MFSFCLNCYDCSLRCYFIVLRFTQEVFLIFWRVDINVEDKIANRENKANVIAGCLKLSPLTSTVVEFV